MRILNLLDDAVSGCQEGAKARELLRRLCKAGHHGGRKAYNLAHDEFDRTVAIIRERYMLQFMEEVIEVNDLNGENGNRSAMNDMSII